MVRPAFDSIRERRTSTRVTPNVRPDDSELVSVIDELPFWSAPFGMQLLERIPFSGISRVLDIGSGLGFPVCEVAMRMGSEVQVVATDPWAAALSRLSLKRRMYDLANLDIVRCVAEHLPFPSDSFDLLISNNGINNVQDLERTLSECHRVLRSGAQFVFTMNLDDTMQEFYSEYENVLVGHGLEEEIRAMHAHIRSKRPPVEFMKEKLAGAGFRIVEIAHDRFRYRFRDGRAMFHHFLIRLAFLDSWKEILEPDRRDDIFQEIELRLNRVAEAEGEIRLSVPFIVVVCER